MSGAFTQRVSTVLHRAENHVAEDSVADRTARLVAGALFKQSVTKPIGPDDDLRSSGLSSLGLVSLMLSVEAEFDLKIPERDMTPANFRSIARIAGLVQALMEKAPTGG
jgi:acyl carrier protein